MPSSLNGNAIAIVPVKRFAHAKTRLADYLTAWQRKALAVAMLHDTLRTLVASETFRVIYVVTCDPKAIEIAQAYGARIVIDQVEAGTNAAMVQGLAAAKTQKCPVVMLPTDLPCLSAAHVKTAVRAMAKAHCAIAPSKDGGTAILALRRADSIPTAFGPDSFQLHMKAAEAANLETVQLTLNRASRDLDTREDFIVFKRFLPVGRVRQLIYSTREAGVIR